MRYNLHQAIALQTLEGTTIVCDKADTHIELTNKVVRKKPQTKVHPNNLNYGDRHRDKKHALTQEKQKKRH